MYLYSALLFGLITGFHCVGMCGPIALSIGSISGRGRQGFIKTLFYNLGRVFSYSLIGLLFGILGESIKLGGFMKWLSIFSGSLLILYSFSPIIIEKFISKTPLYPKLLKLIGGTLNSLQNKKGVFPFMIAGFVNGFLPCGPVYVAAFASLGTQSLMGSVFYMALFGFGTFPLMILTSMSTFALTQKWRTKLNKMTPVFVFIVGVIIILRGLSLGIPFLSPPIDKFDTEEQRNKMKKHHKVPDVEN